MGLVQGILMKQMNIGLLLIVPFVINDGEERALYE